MPQLEDDSFMDAVLGSAVSLFLSPFEDSAGLDDFEDIAIEGIANFFFFNLKSGIFLIENFLSFAVRLYKSVLILCFYVHSQLIYFMYICIRELRFFSQYFLDFLKFTNTHSVSFFSEVKKNKTDSKTILSFLGTFQRFRGGRSFHRQAALQCRWYPDGISQPLPGDTIDSGAVFERMKLDGITYPGLCSP